MYRSLALFCFISLVLVAGVANAAPMTTPPYTQTHAASLTDWADTFTFPQFSPTLGTLLSVETDVSSAFTTTLTVMNSSADSSSGTAKTEVQITLQDAGDNFNAPQLDLLSAAYHYSLASGQGVTSGLLSKSGEQVDTYTTSAILAEFTGSGTISLPVSTFTQTDLSNTGGNTSSSQVTDASVTGSVIYTYQPVPEPATLSLLGLGALALIRRRRKQADVRE